MSGKRVFCGQHKRSGFGGKRPADRGTRQDDPWGATPPGPHTSPFRAPHNTPAHRPQRSCTALAPHTPDRPCDTPGDTRLVPPPSHAHRSARWHTRCCRYTRRQAEPCHRCNTPARETESSHKGRRFGGTDAPEWCRNSSSDQAPLAAPPLHTPPPPRTPHSWHTARQFFAAAPNPAPPLHRPWPYLPRPCPERRRQPRPLHTKRTLQAGEKTQRGAGTRFYEWRVSRQGSFCGQGDGGGQENAV